MSELKNVAAVELSEIELDTVAGGVVTVGNANEFSQSAANDFFGKNLVVAQGTLAGPGGSTTESITQLVEIGSSAGQSIAVG